jgi:methionyl-tRNA formyltransferase
VKRRILFMGTPQFAVPVLQHLLDAGYSVIAVCTRPDKPAGRNKHIQWSPVKRLAVEQGLPLIQLGDLKAPQTHREIGDFNPEIIITAAFGRILPPEILKLPVLGCLNVHPSLLPRHRGPSPVASAILQGDTLTGVTIMLVDQGMDSGPILARREKNISREDTTGSLTFELAELGAALLVETLPAWLHGKIQPTLQEENQATYSQMVTKKDGLLDFRLPAEELWRQVKAYHPWPGAYTWWRGKRLIVHRSLPLNEEIRGATGEVIATPGPCTAGVITRSGILTLCQVQLEGKRLMSAVDFLRGQKAFIGSQLG